MEPLVVFSFWIPVLGLAQCVEARYTIIDGAHLKQGSLNAGATRRKTSQGGRHHQLQLNRSGLATGFDRPKIFTLPSELITETSELSHSDDNIIGQSFSLNP